MDRVSNLPETESRYFEDEIVVLGGENAFFVHRKTSHPQSPVFIRWSFERMQVPEINSDVWRVSMIEEVSRTGTWSFTPIRTLVNRSEELEFALKERDAFTGEANAGFMGGIAHGNHSCLNAVFLIDGMHRSPAAGMRVLCRQFEFIQDSQVWYYDPSGGHSFDRAAKMGVLRNRWNLTGRGAELSLHWTWERSIETAPLFMAMLPFARGDGTDFVSSEARRSPKFQPEDITGRSGTLKQLPLGETRLSGTLGITARLRILEVRGEVANTGMTVAKQPAKNKVYHFLHRGIASRVGDVIFVRAAYDIDSDN
jgi:hypothetical protein